MAGVKVKIDVKELVAFSKKIEKVAKATKSIISTNLNDMGDSLVAVMAQNLVRDTGLSLEEVRGLFKVKRASRGSLAYEVRVDQRLLDEGARKLEGQRESGDFGKRQPGALVIIVSKKDELVCMDCEELEAAGPMPVEIAKQHIPKHPNCRCIMMPYVQRGKRIGVTMTPTSATNLKRRVGGKKGVIHVDTTLRQLAQRMLDKSTRAIRIELK